MYGLVFDYSKCTWLIVCVFQCVYRVRCLCCVLSSDSIRGVKRRVMEHFAVGFLKRLAVSACVSGG